MPLNSRKSGGKIYKSIDNKKDWYIILLSNNIIIT